MIDGGGAPIISHTGVNGRNILTANKKLCVCSGKNGNCEKKGIISEIINIGKQGKKEKNISGTC